MPKTLKQQSSQSAYSSTVHGQKGEARLGNKLLLLVAGGFALVLVSIFLVVVFTSRPIAVPHVTGPSGVAIVPLKGEIVSSMDSFDAVGAGAVVQLIEDAEGNPAVGAILMDIDSPGGEVVASKQIVYRIRESKKPVYSYIGSVGASGAYYVAASTQYIMADRDSITASIGVISEIPNLEGLLEKIGVKVNVLKEGEHKDIGSPFREITEDEDKIFKSILGQINEGFKNDVLEFRQGRITRQRLDDVADGRILTGKQAYENNLVDELVTTKKKAIERAGQLAGIENPYPIPYEKASLSVFDFLFLAGEEFGSGFIKSLNSQASGDFKVK